MAWKRVIVANRLLILSKPLNCHHFETIKDNLTILVPERAIHFINVLARF